MHRLQRVLYKGSYAAAEVVCACAPRTASWACPQPRVAVRSSAATDSGEAPCAARPAHALGPAPQQSCTAGATVRWAPLAAPPGTPHLAWLRRAAQVHSKHSVLELFIHTCVCAHQGARCCVRRRLQAWFLLLGRVP